MYLVETKLNREEKERFAKYAAQDTAKLSKTEKEELRACHIAIPKPVIKQPEMTKTAAVPGLIKSPLKQREKGEKRK